MANNIQGATLGSMPSVNPLNYPSEVCTNCGCEIFVPGVIFKKVPGVLVGQGSEDVEVPLKIFYCQKCGALSPYDQEIIEKAKETSEKAKKSNLIL